MQNGGRPNHRDSSQSALRTETPSPAPSRGREACGERSPLSGRHATGRIVISARPAQPDIAASRFGDGDMQPVAGGSGRRRRGTAVIRWEDQER